MEGDEFSMPSPKRQRTISPTQVNHDAPITTNDSAVSHSTMAKPNHETIAEPEKDVTNLNLSNSDGNEILDALMQHVESETMPGQLVTEGASHGASSLHDGNDLNNKHVQSTEMESLDPLPNRHDVSTREVATESANPQNQAVPLESVANDIVQEPPPASKSQPHQQVDLSETQRAALQIDGIPPTETLEHVEGAGEAEWEIDSSPYESSTDSTDSSSSEDSDDDDDDADGDYAMLDPEEAARILMQADAGSDDEGDRSKNHGEGSGLKTANEQFEDVPYIPDIIISEDMKIEELGSVEAVVENNVLIRGKVSGEYQVLESGSLLCLANRKVAGVVAETLGRIEQPLYTTRFSGEEAIRDRGLSEKGTTVYYVPQHSTFVFTQPLKAFKGSDASNFHDEEVGDEEMEFSDDEAELEHKRQLKLKRQGRTGETGRGRGSGRGARGGQRGGYKPSPLSTDVNSSAYRNGSLEMNYDDVEEGEEGYTRLARPNNLHEMTNSTQASEGSSPSYMPPPPFSDRGRGRGHSRGRGQDRNGRGGRGNFRGNHNNSNRGGSYNQNKQSPTQAQAPFPKPFQHTPYPYAQQPSAPSLVPQNSPYPYPGITSPMSPLPNPQFNFGAGFQGAQSYNPGFHQQQQWAQQMPTGFAPQFNNTANMQFAQQFQQIQQQQQNNGWQVNQAAAAEVQRQLEEMRRAQGGGQ